MELHGLHILLTYQCNLECDHCFVFGSTRQSGTFTFRRLDDALVQAKSMPGCEWIYFEGGEPFLFYPLLRHGVETAHDMGFKVGIVSNGYWALTEWDAEEWLRPFSGLVHDLSISSDLYHWSEQCFRLAKNAERAAQNLGIPAGVIAIAQPEEYAIGATGQLPEGESKVMYRGRAAENLAAKTPGEKWETYQACPHEDLKDPGRVHLDPLGNVHLCQGISIGNLWKTPLKDICDSYHPEKHPIAGPILAGGPAELARQMDWKPSKRYADACHLCFETRKAVRPRFPEILGPDQMYEVCES